MSSHRRVLALDVGAARIGLAVGETGGSLAFGRGAILRHGNKTDAEAVLEAAEREHAKLVLVGLPLRLDGSSSDQTARVRAFGAVLQQRLQGSGIAFEYEDERLTTKLAGQRIADGALPRGKRQEKGLVDEASAVLILESYLQRVLASAEPVTDPDGGAG